MYPGLQVKTISELWRARSGPNTSRGGGEAECCDKRGPDVAEAIRAEDMDLVNSTPAEFDRVRRDMIGKWERIVRQPGFEGTRAEGR